MTSRSHFKIGKVKSEVCDLRHNASKKVCVRNRFEKVDYRGIVSSMKNTFWLNLPSKDLPRAQKFFTELGFVMNEQHKSDGMVSMLVGDKSVVVNLFPDAIFQSFSGHAITDTNQSNEVLFSFGANSPDEVDEYARKAVAAGGVIYAKPGYKDGWMYGCGFTDLDGHRWSPLFMDMSKFPKA